MTLYTHFPLTQHEEVNNYIICKVLWHFQFSCRVKKAPTGDVDFTSHSPTENVSCAS